MNSRIFVPILVAGVGLALGIYLGRGPLTSGPASASSPRPSLVLGSPGVSVLDGVGPSSGGADGKNGVPGSAKPSSAAAEALLEVINNPNGQAAVNRFYQMLAGMPSSEIADLIVNIDSYPNHSRRRETREMIIDYLAMADPRKALEIREELPNNGIFSKAFRQLGRNNPEEALRMLPELNDTGDRSSALTAIFVGASEVDPAGAFALLLKTADASPQHYHEVFDNWAEMDPVTAARMALTVEKPAARRQALEIVGQEWAERDPQAVLDWIGKTDLTSYEREIIRTSALNAYAKRDAGAALDLLDTLDTTTKNRALPNVMRELIRTDAQAAADWMRNAPDSFAKYRAIQDTGYIFANEAPEMAIDLARDIPELKDNALSNAFSTLASRDLDLALHKAQEWKDDPQYQSIMTQIASGYGQTNPEEALAWADGLEDSVRQSAVGSVINRIANNDPSLAVEHLQDLRLGEQDPIYQSAISNIASSWARQDPVSAAEWLDTLPESGTRSSAVANIADNWARIDPVSASEWIGTLDAGPGRDQAAQQLVNRIQREDPEMAAAWAASIGDENIRNNVLNNVLSQWQRMDPQGAAEAAAAAPLPEEMKQRFYRSTTDGAAIDGSVLR